MFKKTKVSISSMRIGFLVTYVVQRIKYDPRHSLNNPDRFVDLILSFPVDHKDDVSVVSSLLHIDTTESPHSCTTEYQTSSKREKQFPNAAV